MVNRRHRGINPRAKNMLVKLVNAFPTETARDYHVRCAWQIAAERKEGVTTLNRPLTEGVINKMIAMDDDLLHLAMEGKIAVPRRKTERSKYPEWLSKVPNRDAVPRIEPGAAEDAIRAELLERANAMTNPDARRRRIEMIEHGWGFFEATPSNRVLAYSVLVDDAEGVTEQIERTTNENVELRDQVKAMLEQSKTTNRLIARLLKDEEEVVDGMAATDTGRRGREKTTH